MDHSNHPRLSPNELTEAALLNAAIYGPENEKVGTISHVHGSGASAQVIVDVGGFLGIGAKPVAITASDLDFMRDEHGTVHALTLWRKDDLKTLPEHFD